MSVALGIPQIFTKIILRWILWPDEFLTQFWGTTTTTMTCKKALLFCHNCCLKTLQALNESNSKNTICSSNLVPLIVKNSWNNSSIFLLSIFTLSSSLYLSLSHTQTHTHRHTLSFFYLSNSLFLCKKSANWMLLKSDLFGRHEVVWVDLVSFLDLIKLQ